MEVLEASKELSSVKQACEMAEVSRSWFYQSQAPTKPDESDLKQVQAIRELYHRCPFYGYRKIGLTLKDIGLTPKKARRLMARMGLQAVYPKHRTTIANKAHETYPYLLKDKQILAPNHVWATDITYIKLNGTFVYLAAIIDLYSRKVLSWRISNTADAQFTVDVLEEALRTYGTPAIFNTDQGCQFTSEKFTGVLKSNGIRISMDGKGRALDNIYVERLWRTLKYEEIYLNSYAGLTELRTAIARYFHFYNTERIHQSLEYRTPEEIYAGAFGTRLSA